MKPAEQFTTFEQQEHAWRFGMWLFLASEILLFAGLFALYAAYRVLHHHEFVAGISHNDLTIGTINTVLLITSSFTVALAVEATRHDRTSRATVLLAMTILLGTLFLRLKAHEWATHFRHGIVPHRGPIFYTLYYFMTGLHALHVAGGLVVLSWLSVRSAQRRYSSAFHLPLELGGLYWHLVDAIWFFLWPLFYLTR